MSCNCNKTKLCEEKKCTGCSVKNLTANCVEVNLEEFPCSGIIVPNTLDQVLLAMDEFICNKVDSISNFISLTNIGGGAEFYAGDNVIGKKQLRTLTSDDLSVTITQTTDTVDLSVNVQETPIESIGTGNPVYVGEVAGSDQIASILDTSTVGFTPLYNGYEGGDHKFAGINSSTIEIVKDINGNILLNTPPQFIGGVPRYIVNNGYTGTEEEGSIAKPFKTVDAAVAKFVGTGDINTPENQNAVIVIQQGISSYNYTGDFSYRNINITVESGATLIHNPADNRRIMDLDILNSTTDVVNTVFIQNGAILSLQGNGFRNGGSTVANTVKGINLLGDGTGRLDMKTEFATTYSLLEINPENSNTFVQGSFSEIQLRNLDVRVSSNPVWKVGHNASLIVYDSEVRAYREGTYPFTPEEHKPFQQYGGSVITENTLYVTDNGSLNNVFYFNTDTAIVNSEFNMTRCIMQFLDFAAFPFFNGTAELSTNKPSVAIRYSSTRFSQFDTLVNSLNDWNEVLCMYNTIDGGYLEGASVDLTRNNTTSVQNYVRQRLKEHLVTYGTRNAAKTALGPDSKFINTNGGNVDTATWFIDITI